MDEKIKAAVKTLFSKYGLKDASIEKIVNIVKSRVEAMGTIETDKLDEIINSSVKESEPFIAIIQSEADARSRKSTDPDSHKLQEPREPQEPKGDEEPPAWAKALIDDNKKLKEAIESREKQEGLNKLKADAIKLASSKGATNAKLAEKAFKLVQIEDGMTAEQVADLLITEYNDLYTETTEGAVPSIPEGRKLSEAELAKQREESTKHSKDELLKDKNY